jgi:hypothetical protein
MSRHSEKKNEPKKMSQPVVKLGVRNGEQTPQQAGTDNTGIEYCV